MTTKPPLLEVRNMTVSYGHRPILRAVGLTLEAGRLMGIVGPSGAGKSTLLKAVLGLIPMESGQVLMHGKPLSRPRGRIAYLPQRGDIDWDFPATALDVVLMGRYRHVGWLRRPGPEDVELARRILDRVGMAPFADRQIGRLSGGQQQRVFLARALVQDTELFILDEPFVGVDAASEKVIWDILDELRAAGRALLMVNHDLSVVERYDTLMFLNGHVVAKGPPEEVFTPENLRRLYGTRVITIDETVGLP